VHGPKIVKTHAKIQKQNVTSLNFFPNFGTKKIKLNELFVLIENPQGIKTFCAINKIILLNKSFNKLLDNQMFSTNLF
jgi:hypothetical protein